MPTFRIYFDHAMPVVTPLEIDAITIEIAIVVACTMMDQTGEWSANLDNTWSLVGAVRIGPEIISDADAAPIAVQEALCPRCRAPRGRACIDTQTAPAIPLENRVCPDRIDECVGREPEIDGLFAATTCRTLTPITPADWHAAHAQGVIDNEQYRQYLEQLSESHEQ